MSRSGYRQALRPILRHAEWVTLVDPFLSPGKDEKWPILEICASLLPAVGKGPGSGLITVHSTMGDYKGTSSSLLDHWGKLLAALSGQPGSHRPFRVVLWKKRSRGGPRFHDRALFTNQCGVDVPGGFDCWDETKNTTRWHLIDHRALWECDVEFDRRYTPHEWINECPFP